MTTTDIYREIAEAIHKGIYDRASYLAYQDPVPNDGIDFDDKRLFVKNELDRREIRLSEDDLARITNKVPTIDITMDVTEIQVEVYEREVVWIVEALRTVLPKLAK